MHGEIIRSELTKDCSTAFFNPKHDQMFIKICGWEYQRVSINNKPSLFLKERPNNSNV